jgi:hypothetical protein
LGEITQTVVDAGLADPTTGVYLVQPMRRHVDLALPWDHTWFPIASVTAPDGTTKPLEFRVLGDPLGAGLFRGVDEGDDLGPPLCLTWDELSMVIDSAYKGGGYLTSFVCHTITATALETLGIARPSNSLHVKGWSLAEFAFGPRSVPGLVEATASPQAGRCSALPVAGPATPGEPPAPTDPAP